MPIKEIKNLIDIDVNGDNISNIHHLMYTFEGYRSIILHKQQPQEGYDCNPYSPGSARACSWEIGAEMVKRDITQC